MNQPRFNKDSGEKMTISEIVRQMAEKLDANDESGAILVINDLFLNGSWGHLLDPSLPDVTTLREDMCGMFLVAYRTGKTRGEALKERANTDDIPETDMG